MTVEGRFRAALDDIFADAPPQRLAVAVSGGGDSVALMHLACSWAAESGLSLEAVTVDHRLRPESGAEAKSVAAAAERLGVPHTILAWQEWDGAGNLQDAARRARRALIEGWASERAIGTVLTGHTLDDQAETVLMRLARGSGVDGLAGIPRVRRRQVTWLRPLLSVRRGDLRTWLRDRGIGWAEDPSNDDPRFDRVRARHLLGALSDLGLTAERLDATARHMQRAQEVLHRAAQDLARRAVETDAGDLLIALFPFRAAAADTRTRLLAAALCWVSGATYRPRYAALERIAADPSGGVLHGCLVTRETDRIRVSREPAATAGLTVSTDAIWDGRWRLDGPHEPGLEIRALTAQGLARYPGWRDTGHPAASLQASPAVWRGPEVVAAPLVEPHRDWTARLIAGRDQFNMESITR